MTGERRIRYFDRLGDFIAALDAPASCADHGARVAAKLELATISDRVMKQPGGGKALLFEHVLLDDGTRSPYPVAINLFGSMRRMAMALGAGDLDAIGRRITELLELKVPDGLLGQAGAPAAPPRSRQVPAANARPARRPPGRDRGGARTIDLGPLPILTCWPRRRRSLHHAARW